MKGHPSISVVPQNSFTIHALYKGGKIFQNAPSHEKSPDFSPPQVRPSRTKDEFVQSWAVWAMIVCVRVSDWLKEKERRPFPKLYMMSVWEQLQSFCLWCRVVPLFHANYEARCSEDSRPIFCVVGCESHYSFPLAGVGGHSILPSSTKCVKKLPVHCEMQGI